ncbi:hypothetical protein EJB05_39267, partial [Eragrostis curvula]
MTPAAKAKRRGTTPSAGPAARDADLISRLPDDVLLHILALLPDARDAARTDALLRRWRGLWARVPALRFSSRSCWPELRDPVDAGRYAALVDAFLSRRAAAQQTEPIESLSILFDAGRMRGPEVEPAVPSSMARAATGWIRYAVQHAVRRFVLDQSGPWNGEDLFHMYPCYRRHVDEEALLMDLEDLPSSIDLGTMHLRITRARIRFPATAVFASLTDLSLECIRIAAGSSHLFARFLSSKCCPRLLRLRIQDLRLMELRIEADTLVELTLEKLEKGCSLELRTPILRTLRMIFRGSRPEMLRISAPRLEELTFQKDDGPDHIVVDGELPFMENLTVYLRTHGHSVEDDYNDVGIHLLQCCTSVRCLTLHLDTMRKHLQVVDKINGRIPHLPHVTSLTVRFRSFHMHPFGFGLDHILTQCTSLKHLCIQCYVIKPNYDSESYSLCDHPNRWQSCILPLTHLQDVELRGLTATDCDLWFMQLLLASTTKLKKVNVSFDPEYMQSNTRDAFELIPRLGGGAWTYCDNCCSYEWKPCMSGEHISECDWAES